jgi:hypothetical protein
VRIVRTLLNAWRRYRHHPDPRVGERVAWECRSLATLYAGVLWAAERWFRRRPSLQTKIRAVGQDLRRAFGWRARVLGPLVGRFLLTTMHREERRLRRGWTYEPPTFYETNRPEEARRNGSACVPSLCRWVEPRLRDERSARTA